MWLSPPPQPWTRTFVGRSGSVEFDVSSVEMVGLGRGLMELFEDELSL